MPNWCVNKLSITGNAKDINALVKRVDGDGEVFSFAAIVPPPDTRFYSINEEQNHFQCGCKAEFHETTPAIGEPFTEGFVSSKGDWRVNGKPVLIIPSDQNAQSIKAVFDEQFVGGKEVCPEHLVEKYSRHPDWWYNWNVAHWGTKWSAGDAHIERHKDTHITYHFDTAWAPPMPVVEALAEQFPTLSFEFSFCEGGMGFAGRAIYTGGTLLSEESYDDGASMPDEAYFPEDDGTPGYERDYEKVPATAYERFCLDEFGGVVGG
jgi:hypothetical protein